MAAAAEDAGLRSGLGLGVRPGGSNASARIRDRPDDDEERPASTGPGHTFEGSARRRKRLDRPGIVAAAGDELPP